MWWLPGEQGHTGRFLAGICWWSTLVQAGHFSWGPPHYHHPLLGIHIPPYIPEGPWASWLLATCGEWERDLYKISEHRCHHSCWMIDGHCAGSHLSVVLSGLQHKARPLPQLYRASKSWKHIVPTLGGAYGLSFVGYTPFKRVLQSFPVPLPQPMGSLCLSCFSHLCNHLPFHQCILNSRLKYATLVFLFSVLCPPREGDSMSGCLG